MKKGGVVASLDATSLLRKRFIVTGPDSGGWVTWLASTAKDGSGLCVVCVLK
jgi:PhoPQ-activated pathogenicity-related protein